MPVKRSHAPVTIRVSDGGRTLPDYPVGEIGAANYSEKLNFRREDKEDRKIEGWDYPTPTDSWIGDGLTNFHDGHPAEAINMIRRANGQAAIVGAGAGLLKVFDYDGNEWVTIGSGFSVQGDSGFRYWKIIDVAGFAVFNNGRDLPVTWQIGDPSVLPIYEMREAGYASVGDIEEYAGILRCADILEINDDAMEAVMTDPLPYKTIVDGATTTRIVYRRIWSNIDLPRDFRATAPGSISAGTNQLILSWPMASLAIGDAIMVNGAGSAGGNLRTVIDAISGDGLTITLHDNASTVVTDTDVYKQTALKSIVGYDDLGEDGSAIVAQVKLKNQLVSFKANGDVFQEYYDGDLEQPFIAERMANVQNGTRFPRAIINVRDAYILFPGSSHFFRYTLGSQEVQEDPVISGAEQKLFFSRIIGAGVYDVWAANNHCTDEVLFAYRWAAYEAGQYGANRALAVCYGEGRESCADIDEFNFTCAVSVNKPTTGFDIDEVERWFLMGDSNGKITRWGKSNLELFTLQRYGESFAASVESGWVNFGADDTGKYLRRFGLLLSDPDSSAAATITIYGGKTTSKAAVALRTKVLNNPTFPGVMNCFFRKPYYKFRLVTSAAIPFAFSGHTWRAAEAETQDVDRLS